MANKYIWCVEIYVFDVQLGYTNVSGLYFLSRETKNHSQYLTL